MKTYNELTSKQQAEALERIFSETLQDMASGALRFDDDKNGDNLQASVDAAIQESEDQQVPWFAAEFILEATYIDPKLPDEDNPASVRDFIEGISLPVVEMALYPENGEWVIEGVA